MAHKGKYTVRNRSKYVGKVDSVVYRSSWERRFMVWCDDNPAVIAWNSEEVVIPYYSPVDNKMHKYHVDFLIKTRDHALSPGPNTVDKLPAVVSKATRSFTRRVLQRIGFASATQLLGHQTPLAQFTLNKPIDDLLDLRLDIVWRLGDDIV